MDIYGRFISQSTYRGRVEIEETAGAYVHNNFVRDCRYSEGGSHLHSAVDLAFG